MTPFALSGGCQASEMVCLVISLAWMEDTGDGADQKKEKRGKMLKPVTLSHSPMLFPTLETSSLFWPALHNPPLFAPTEKVKQLGRATRQSLPFVFELGDRSRSDALQSCTAQLPKLSARQ